MTFERSIVSISLRKRIRRAVFAGFASGAALLVLAVGPASAATYPGVGSTFTGGAEGWKEATSECKLLNLIQLPLVCTASGAYDGTAGAPPGSYAVDTSIPLNLIGVFHSAVTVESPSFTASGTGAGTLSLSREFTSGGLLNLAPEFGYTAYLVDKTTNTRQKAIAETIETEAPFAPKTGGVSLVAGHTYDIQIEAGASSTLASIGLLGGDAIGRFDNVVVTGPNAEEPPNNNPTQPPNGKPGKNGGNGEEGGGGANGNTGANGGAGGVSSARLESLIRSSSLIGPATLKGNVLTVKASCPKKVGATCTLSLQGMLSKSKAATGVSRARVKLGKTKQFKLKVKPAALPKVKAKQKLLFKETVRAGKAHTTVMKSLKLVRK
jgi:hypothetical protein